MKLLRHSVLLLALVSARNLHAAEPIFVPIKIDGPVQDKASNTYWYGPFNEGCAIIDMNGDGKPDITCGPNWYENPTWKKHEGIREVPRVGEFFSNNGEVAVDINKDGKPDLISSGWQTNGVYWYENPGKPGVPWKPTKIMDSDWTEGFIVEDLDGDGDDDVLICHWDPKPGQGVTWIEQLPGAKFATHMIGTQGDQHGIGLGDINGDGRKDIVTPVGWWEAPVDRANGQWTFHADYKCEGHLGIRMPVIDVNGDGLADIIYGNGHGYGLYWLEQKPTTAKGGARTFERHVIDDSLSQFHTLVLADVNQDGKLDLVTGKRLRGHGDDDPGSFDPMFVVWYDIQGGKFVPHMLSYNNMPWYDRVESPNPVPNYAIGTGMNINVVDMNGDGKVDIVVAGKSGVYLFMNRGLPPTKRMR